MNSSSRASSQAQDPQEQDIQEQDIHEQGAQEQDKALAVRQMFNAIAGRYDLLNHLLSLGMDRRWRLEATDVAFEELEGQPARVLDVATGTGDLALLLKQRHGEADITGVDFAEQMLTLARRKAAREHLEVHFQEADGSALPFPEGSFDAVTIAYGLRNFADYRQGLRECCRVLAPGGRLVVLEFPPPPKGFFGRLFRFYFLRVLPIVGGLISGKRGAYAYLPASVIRFPVPPALASMMREVGFVGVRYKLQTLGISALHTGEKP